MWPEYFGHALLLVVVIALVTGRLHSWAPLVVYIAAQLAVMTIGRFKTWHAWPFILRDWRQKGRIR